VRKLFLSLLAFTTVLPLTWYVYTFSSGVGEMLFSILIIIYLYYILYYSKIEFEVKSLEFFKFRKIGENKSSYLTRLSSVFENEGKVLLASILREIIVDYISYRYNIPREEVENILKSRDAAQKYLHDETILKFLFSRESWDDYYEILERIEKVLE